jgi:Spy/CpxP family protein refolding chaperone
MTRARFVAASVLAASLTLGGAAFAQGSGGPVRGGRFGGAAGGLGLPVRELNLSDAQQDQIRDIVQRHRDEMRMVQDRLREAREEQRQAIEAVPLNEGAIRAVTTQQLANAEADAAILQARVRSEVWAVLTPDQQAQATKLRAARDTRKEQRQERLQNRGRRQRPGTGK